MSNFVVKKYRHRSASENAVMIASEIITTGESIGWSGSLEEKESVEVILNQFNIFYVDDMFGTYKLKK